MQGRKGDGEKNLRDLIGIKNIDWEVGRFLKAANLSMNFVPKKGEMIVYRGNSNRSTGGIVENVTDKVLNKFKKIAGEAAIEFKLGIAGIDMIIEDAQDENSAYCILESNASPGFGMHRRPDIGRSIDPFPLILETIIHQKPRRVAGF